MVSWSCWARSRNTRSWKFRFVTVDVPEELGCEMEDEDAGSFDAAASGTVAREELPQAIALCDWCC